MLEPILRGVLRGVLPSGVASATRAGVASAARAGVICAAWACLASSASAAQLSGQQIGDLVAGATIEIETPTGTRLPIHYMKEGRLAGEARELAWYLGAPRDTGRWWVAGDQLCHKWLRWFNGEPQCMRVSREGRVFRWRSEDGNTGIATITTPAPPPVQTASVLSLPRALPKRAPETRPEPAAPAQEPEPAADAAPAAAAPAPFATAVIAEAAPAPHVPAPVPAVRPRQPAEPQATQPKAATSPAPPQPAAPKPATFMVANVRHDDVLNVRSGPSPDFDIVGELTPDSRGIAIVSECRERWCRVEHHSASGWVNSAFLAPEGAPGAFHDSPEAPRSCLTQTARALLGRIEQTFGPVQVISTCRAGAVIAGTGHPSRHASGNAIDFNAGARKTAIVAWLIANHHAGGTMTYAGMDHIHVDIGPHFVSIAGGRHWASWREAPRARTSDTADDD